MGWLASFKGLRNVGVPPVIAAAVLIGLFLVFRSKSDGDTADNRMTEPATA